MSILVSNIRIGIEEDDAAAIELARKSIGIRYGQIENARIYKKSIDARHQSKIAFVVSVAITLRDEKLEKSIVTHYKNVSLLSSFVLKPVHGTNKCTTPIVIIGFGPAGIFAAYLLAKEGYRPIVFERGADIDSRACQVNDFWNSRVFNSETNVQFGEGGAGAFSDGKLTTRINDPRCGYILSALVKNGAPSEILMQAKPHVGTDEFHHVIKSMRETIIKNGGEIHFNARVDSINTKNGKVYSVTIRNHEIETNRVILAVGHSARDMFTHLFESGVEMIPKNFSVGVRIEHRQKMINSALYGESAQRYSEHLPQGEYQLSYKNRGRCAYTFCMCPGGIVVAANSEPDSIVTNGMSYHARNGANANAALVVSVDSSDFGNHPLDGMRYQQLYEKKAFEMAGKDYSAPASLVGDFLDGRVSHDFGTVIPTYPIGVNFIDFHKLFPKYITDMLEQGLIAFNSRLNGFAHKDSILTGPETRTSSPIRISRTSEFQSVNIDGLYPCGEGAGYAGGIMSAAADGLRVAEKIINEFSAD